MATPEELNIFKPFPEIKDILRREWREYKPITPLVDSCCVEFQIPALAKQYIDLRNTRLKVKVAITKADGTLVTQNDVQASGEALRGGGSPDPDKLAVGPVNNVLSSIFSQVDVTLNGLNVSPGVGVNHGYKAMMSTLIDEGGKSHNFSDELLISGFRIDLMPDAHTVTSSYSWFLWGSEMIKDGYTCFEGKIRSDVTELSHIIPNSVGVGIRMYQSTDSFRLWANKDETLKLKILDCSLNLCVLSPSDEALISMEEKFSKGNAVFDFDRSEVKCFQLAKGSYTTSLENMFANKELPTEIVAGFVASKAYSGDINTNPFYFDHVNVSHFDASVDGTYLPGPPLKPNFVTNDYTESYLRLVKDNDQQNLGISYSSFKNGSALFRFNLSNVSDDKEVRVPKQSGNLRITISFREALKENMTLILYAKYKDCFYMDKFRTVLLSS